MFTDERHQGAVGVGQRRDREVLGERPRRRERS